MHSVATLPSGAVDPDDRSAARSGGPPAGETRATVIIVNYEGRGRLGRCLDALLADAQVRFETIVIDNASSDHSWDEAEGRPGVRLVRNRHNAGFGCACNQAAALAASPFLVFLNFDSVAGAGLARGTDGDRGVRSGDRRRAGCRPDAGRNREHRGKLSAFPGIFVGPAPRLSRRRRPSCVNRSRLRCVLARAQLGVRAGRRVLGGVLPLLRGHRSLMAHPPGRL